MISEKILRRYRPAWWTRSPTKRKSYSGATRPTSLASTPTQPGITSKSLVFQHRFALSVSMAASSSLLFSLIKRESGFFQKQNMQRILSFCIVYSHMILSGSSALQTHLCVSIPSHPLSYICTVMSHTSVCFEKCMLSRSSAPDRKRPTCP